MSNPKKPKPVSHVKQNVKTTEGIPHKQHKDRNTTLPPKPTPKPR